MQRPSLGTASSSSTILSSHTTLAKPWYSLWLKNNTAIQMDCKSEISTRYDMFLVLQRFHGILNIKMPEQSLFWASNVWNKLLVSAHWLIKKISKMKFKCNNLIYKKHRHQIKYIYEYYKGWKIFFLVHSLRIFVKKQLFFLKDMFFCLNSSFPNAINLKTKELFISKKKHNPLYYFSKNNYW